MFDPPEMKPYIAEGDNSSGSLRNESRESLESLSGMAENADGYAFASTSGEHVDTGDGPHLSSQQPQATVPSLRRGMACAFCRRRKLKCSGERPVCSNCIKYKKQCEYGSGAKVAKVRALESRIAQLSSFIQSSGMSGLPLAHNGFPPQDMPDGQFGDSSFQSGHEMEGYDPSYDQTYGYLDLSGAEAPTGFNGSNLSELPAGFDGRFGLSVPPNGPQPPQSARPNTQGAPLPQWAAPYTAGPASMGYPGFLHPQEPSNFGTFPPLSSADMGFNSFTSSGNPPSAPFPPSNPTSSPYAFVNQPTQPTSITDSVPAPPTNSDAFLASGHQMGAMGNFRVNPSSSNGTPPSAGMSGQTNFSHRSSPFVADDDGQTWQSNSLDRIIPGQAGSGITNIEKFDTIDGITERLGEFLFSPQEADAKANVAQYISHRGSRAASASLKAADSVTPDVMETFQSSFPIPDPAMGNAPQDMRMSTLNNENDGLTESQRDILIDCFLAHSHLFFEMNFARFRYRMTFYDKRRPHPSFLFAMYLWATRMSNSPTQSAMEKHFFARAGESLDVSTANNDRLMDSMRAAMLLSAYSFTSGRFHEGWILSGVAVRIVHSTGLHQIPSLVHRIPPSKNPFLRSKVYLLPPAEDPIELGERVHTFWCIYAVDRSGAVATGFASGFKDDDITTPFPLPLADICAGNVTAQDDGTLRDLYRPSYAPPVKESHYVKWIKALTLLERAAKLAFLDPEENSEWNRAWQAYDRTVQDNPSAPPPPPWLNQPRYRCPQAYTETKLGLDQFLANMGDEGVSPVDRMRNYQVDKAGRGLDIPTECIILHHHLAAVWMLLHDINSLDCENKEALTGARRSVALFRSLPVPPPQVIDAFCILVLSMICKTLLKEMHRLRLAGCLDAAVKAEEDANLYIEYMRVIGMGMHLSRTQAVALEELKRRSLNSSNGNNFAYPS